MAIVTFPMSDHPLACRVRLSLQGQDSRLNGIVVDATGPEIVHLSGQANSFHLRQLAVSIAKHVPGVRHVSDGIQVSTSPPRKKPR
jgi:osmotically-inducible protein OsmY